MGDRMLDDALDAGFRERIDVAERQSEALRSRGLKVTRLARGLPTGTQLEFANKAVLADAIEGRQRVG